MWTLSPPQSQDSIQVRGECVGGWVWKGEGGEWVGGEHMSMESNMGWWVYVF